jgi:hypothetical protein
MIGNKYSGDGIAAEFARLMRASGPNIEKTAEVNTEGATTPEEISVDASDFLVSRVEDEPNSGAAQKIENSIVDIKSDAPIDSAAATASTKRSGSRRGRVVMAGLGRIAGSLRAKGSGFAADMVDATALSVARGLESDRKRRASVASELGKIASELNKEGNSFASDLVKVTVNKILND